VPVDRSCGSNGSEAGPGVLLSGQRLATVNNMQSATNVRLKLRCHYRNGVSATGVCVVMKLPNIVVYFIQFSDQILRMNERTWRNRITYLGYNFAKQM
jgi:hypothetical protein